MTVNTPPRAGQREWIGLAVLALPTMLLSLDLSVLFLAIPHLSADLEASSTEQLWISDIYGFMTAGFLITMGSLGDRIGRRRLLLTGAAVFGIASALAAYSTGPEMLIVTRALLGIAGASMLPSTLALLRTMFHDPKQMGTAIAGWTTAYMAGVALGPVVGGVMLDNFWWGSVFLLGLPVMALLLLVGPVLLPEYSDPAAGRLDLTSVALSLAAILPVIWGLKQLAADGWGSAPVVAVVVGAVVGAVFVVRQRRLADPLLDLRLFGIRTVRAALLMAVLIAALQNGNAFMVTLYLQMVEGLSPLKAGLWLVLPSLALIVTINATPYLARRFRPGHVYAGGLLLSAIGYLLLTQVDTSGGMTLLVIAIIIVYAGVGPGGSLTNQFVLGAAPPEKAGSAASMGATSGEFGIALGIATLGSVGTAVYSNRLDVPAGVSGESADSARESIASAVAEAGSVGGATGAELLDAARDAFTTTLNTVAGIGAVLFLAITVLSVAVLGHIPRTGEADPDAPPEQAAAGQAGDRTSDQVGDQVGDQPGGIPAGAAGADLDAT